MESFIKGISNPEAKNLYYGRKKLEVAPPSPLRFQPHLPQPLLRPKPAFLIPQVYLKRPEPCAPLFLAFFQGFPLASRVMSFYIAV